MRLEDRDNAKVFHYTIGRCGSAFISQILFHLFGEDYVWAGHETINYRIKPEQKIVITYRDFRDVMVSYWRTANDIPLDRLESRKMSDREVRVMTESIVSACKDNMMPTYNANRDAILIRYEDFFPDNFDYVFEKLSGLDVHFTDELKKEINTTYNLAKNRERSVKAGSFRNIGEHWMHGRHVYKGEIGGWKKLVPNHMHRFVNNQFSEILNKWGYTV